ncbi:MAG: hypothetical protein K5873_10075 [Treponema sp.]|nr:hypothetical protein [Treponema sp.]
MKKLIAIIAASLTFAGFAFAEAPAFSDPNAFIIDASKMPGKIKDNVKLKNVSSAADFKITVSAYDEKAGTWIIFGEGELKGLGDTETIKSVNKKLIKLANYNYFAITTDSKNAFKYSSSKNHNDLHIWFYDDRNIDESHFTVIDKNQIGTFKDNLKLVGGQSLKSASSFKIYAYNDEADSGKSGTIAILKGAGDTDTYDTASNGLPFSSFRYFKIISREEKDFKYSAKCERNDLIITVEE